MKKINILGRVSSSSGSFKEDLILAMVSGVIIGTVMGIITYGGIFITVKLRFLP